MRAFKLFVVIFLILLQISCDQNNVVVERPPANVSVYVVEPTDIPIYQEYIGETLGFKDIAIRARVQGYLEVIHFKEGSIVDEGKLLYTIESQQYQANVAEKRSKLAEQQTILANAKSDLARYEPLVAEDAISEIEYDSAKTRYEASISSVDAAEADLEAAEIQLGYTKVYSPITGIIGKTQSKVGDYVGSSPSDSLLNTVSSVDPILVQFFITESQYLYFSRRFSKEEREEPGDSQEKNLQLILADDSIYEHKGKFDFIDRSVDTSTGGILIQASFENTEQLLRPGQFAKVKAKIDAIENGILIPQRCVTELQGIFSVYIVDENNKVQNRRVEVGDKIEGFWLIKSGLKPGENIIFEGLQFVKEGVNVNSTIEDVPLPTFEMN